MNILDPKNLLYEIDHPEYLKRRMQFWKWRKHHTLGRPVLLRKSL